MKCKYCGEKINVTSDLYYCTSCGKELKKSKDKEEKQKVKLVTKKVVDKTAEKKAYLDGMKKAFQFISANGIDLDDEDIPLLVLASENSDAELVEALLDSGAYVDTQDSDQNTALHKACENGNNEIVKLLLSNNADVDIENDYSETPLSLARQNGNRYIVGLLHKSGAEDDDDF